MPLLEVENLSVAFHTRDGISEAVKNVSFSLEAGKTLGIVGESGSGKSVTCYSLLGLIPCPPGKVSQGRALFLGEDMLAMTDRQLRDIRGGKISMIFQDPMTSLTPHLRIGDQISESIRLHHPGLNKKQIKQKAIDALQEVGINDAEQRYNAYPHEYSGGMRQRVMIAMALATEPELLIADEPTTALDVTIQAQIIELLKDIQDQRQLAVIFITHDLAVIKSLADEVVVMQKGEIVERGPSLQVFNTPKHPYTQKLIAAIPTTAKPEELKNTINEDETVLDIKDLRTTYTSTSGFFFAPKIQYKHAVKQVSLSIHKGEILGLVGESGSGKSTLGKSVMQLVNYQQGEITLNGRNLASLGREALRHARRDFQMIFQDPYASLNPRMSVYDTLAEPLLLHGIVSKSDSKKLNQHVNALMDDVGLERRFLRKYPHEFSGGQRQRIAIARAIAVRPKLIIADEPVSALDVTIQAQILTLLLELSKKYQLTMLFISHDLAVVRYMCDRVAVMRAGEIVEQNTTERIFDQPTHEYTRALLSAIPCL
ncbi:MAG: ABC transporter ATP-binding protein [Alteromonadaceae bacterium]|nr:MAG: ABC transporter ATP-binding protein [Alteromonadaceae bacterium]